MDLYDYIEPTREQELAALEKMIKEYEYHNKKAEWLRRVIGKLRSKLENDANRGF